MPNDQKPTEQPMSNNPFDRNKTKEARLGEIITEPGEQNQRDAIHIAVVPIIAGTVLRPGQHVGVSDDGRQSRHSGAPVGIVDPFLKANVTEGQTFWLFLYQGQVTTLRHEWTHPAFPNVQQQGSIAVPLSEMNLARNRMEEFARECNQDYDSFIDEVRTAIHETRGGGWGYVNVGDNEGATIYPEFWSDLEKLTGIVRNTGEHISFNCSC